MKRALLFTVRGSADGEAALAYLQARGVAVDVRDAGRDPLATLEVFRRFDRLRLPAIVIGERGFLGFAPNRDAIDAVLRE